MFAGNSLVGDIVEVGEHLQWLNKATLTGKAKWSTESVKGGNEYDSDTSGLMCGLHL